MGTMATKSAEQKHSEGVLVKLKPTEREAVERLAEQESTSMSAVGRRAIVRDLKRRQKAGE